MQMIGDERNPRQSDAAIMAALAQGERAALADLVERYGRRVRAVAYRFSGRWDVADDVAQETFLRVLRAAATYTPSASVATWLYRIVVNLCFDQKRRRRPNELADMDAGWSSTPEADKRAEDAEVAEAVQHAVAALPERERIAVVLHRFEGLSHGQIAQATGWTEPAIESLLTRAYTHLRGRLREWKYA